MAILASPNVVKTVTHYLPGNTKGIIMMQTSFTSSRIISQLGLKKDALRDVTVIVPGAGGGIGYETAQVHLEITLDAELEGTNVNAHAIGRGLVPTETTSKAVGQLASQMGMSVEQFFGGHEYRRASGCGD